MVVVLESCSDVESVPDPAVLLIPATTALAQEKVVPVVALVGV